MSSRRASWKERALHIIDEHERGVGKGRLTQAVLAKLVGVSRQTLWRSNEIRAKLSSYKSTWPHSSDTVKRPSSAAQIRALRLHIEELEAKNARLVQNFIVLCRSLDERGLDAISLMGLSAPDLISGERAAAWR